MAKPRDPELDRIQATMKDRQKSRADLARLLRLDSSQVTRIFAGTRRVQVHELRTIHEWLGLGPSEGQSSGSVHPMPGMVPLYGAVGASSSSRLVLAEQNLLGYVAMHPAQANLRDPFALVVVDESMVPRYEPGETVYVAPHRRPLPGKDAVLVTDESFGFLKRFLGLTEKTVRMSQLNPAEELTFDRAKVTALHAVVGRG